MRRGIFCLAVLALCGLGRITWSQIKVNVRLVDVSVSVYDKHGVPVDGLTQDQFQVLDEGVPQKIRSFESVTGNLTCAILLDTTGSMTDALGAVKKRGICATGGNASG